jgi:predicted RNA-binding Zn ribbon-like protein
MGQDHNSMPALVGGHVVLDLINTVEPRAGGPGLDRLDSVEALVSWAERAGLRDGDEAAPSPQALAATLEIREAAYALLGPRADRYSGETPETSGPLETLQLRRAAAAARSELLINDRKGPLVRVMVGTVAAMRIPDRLATAAVDLLSSVDLAVLRACPVDEGGCGFLFLDHSRNGSRRWCSMTDCGATAKARRLNDRRRARRRTNE